jgi:hypothetical protein
VTIYLKQESVKAGVPLYKTEMLAFPLSKQYILNIMSIQHITFFHLSSNFVTGQSSCSINKHTIQYEPSVQETILHSGLKIKWDSCKFLALRSLSSHVNCPWWQLIGRSTESNNYGLQISFWCTRYQTAVQMCQVNYQMNKKDFTFPYN